MPPNHPFSAIKRIAGRVLDSALGKFALTGVVVLCGVYLYFLLAAQGSAFFGVSLSQRSNLTNGLVAWYTLDGKDLNASTGVVTDASGGGFSGQLNGAASVLNGATANSWSTTTDTTSGGHTYSPAAGVTKVTVYAWGGGGGGGGSTAVLGAGGGAGGGGGFAAIRNFAVSFGNNYSYTVGAGGATSTVAGGGNAGNDSMFSASSTLLAGGGNLGAVGVSGAGGATTSATMHGDFTFTGAAGSSGLSGTRSGYGGGGAGDNADAAAHLPTAAGAGGTGTNTGGAGGVGSTANADTAGSLGVPPGGGGGGGKAKNTGSTSGAAGAAGGNGKVIIGSFTPGNPGVYDNATSTVPGIIGSAYNFDGVNDYINVGTGPSSVKSVSLWMKIASSTASSSALALSGSVSIKVISGVVTTTGFTSPTYYVDGQATSTPTVNDNRWHHVVVTSGTAVNASALKIGLIGTTYYGGMQDDIRFYNRTISPQDTAQLYDIGRQNASYNVFSATPTSNPRTDSSGGGLVGWWTFDGPDMVSNVADVSGNAINGALTLGSSGTVSTTTQPGAVGSSLVFDGIDDTVTLGNVSSSVKSVSFWMKEATSTASSSMVALNGSASVRVLSSVVTATGWTSPTIYVDNVITSALSNTKWHHVVVTSGTAINASSANLAKLGGLISFGGQLDDLRMFSRVLTPQEITRLYKMGASDYNVQSATPSKSRNLDTTGGGLAVWYTFDGPDMVSNVADKSGQGNNGTFSSPNATTTVPGVLGQALVLNGSYVIVDYSPSGLGTGSGANWTLAAWVKPTSADIDTSYHMIMDYGVQTSGNAIQLFLLFNTWHVDNYGPNTLDSQITAVADKWTYVVAECDGVNEWIYINGAVVAGPLATPGEAPTGDQIVVGSQLGGGLPWYGPIDDVRIYNRALSPSEIKALYVLGQ